MNFKEIFKNSFLENYSFGDVSKGTMIISFAIATLLGIYMFFLYRKVTKKTFYSKTFNLSLVALTIITDAIILAIQSNIVVSLGMVGALSIVRFRTAVKDPMDLTFLFWAISVGIICGVNLPLIALIETVVLTIIILVLNIIPMSKAPMLLVINSDSVDTEKSIIEVIKKYTKYYKIKSRNLTKEKEDMIIEIRIKEEEKIVDELSKLQNIREVSLLSHDGEVTF